MVILVNTVTFNVTASNNGPDTATNVTITDVIPSGLSNPLVSANTGNYTINGSVITWTIPSLTTGANATLTLNGTSAPQTTITNTATKIWQSEYDPTLINTTTFKIYIPNVSLYVTNYAWDSGVYTYDYQQQIVMLAQLNNMGSSTATNVVVNYVIGSAFKVISYNLIQPGSLTFNSTTNTFTWIVSQLNGGNNTYDGSFASFSVLMQAIQTGSGGSAFSTTTTIMSCDQNYTGTLTRVRNLIIPTAADVQVTQTPSNYTPTNGSYVTIVVTTADNGPNSATGLTVNDLLPAGLYVGSLDPNTSITASSGTVYNQTSGNWVIGTLNNNTSVTLTIVAKVTAATGTTISNYAYKLGAPTPYDWNTGNDAYDLILNVKNTSVSLYVTNYAWDSGVYTYDYQQQIVMLAQLNNMGSSTATNVVVNYVIGSAFKVISYNLIQPGSLTFNSTTNTFTWIVSQLNGGNNTYDGSFASFSVLMQAIQTGSGGSAFSTTTTIMSCDQNYTGTLTRVRNLIIPTAADVQVTQTPSNYTPTNGSYVTIVVTTADNGPNSATGLTVNDLLPAGLYVGSIGS